MKWTLVVAWSEYDWGGVDLVPLEGVTLPDVLDAARAHFMSKEAGDLAERANECHLIPGEAVAWDHTYVRDEMREAARKRAADLAADAKLANERAEYERLRAKFGGEK